MTTSSHSSPRAGRRMVALLGLGSLLAGALLVGALLVVGLVGALIASSGSGGPGAPAAGPPLTEPAPRDVAAPTATAAPRRRAPRPVRIAIPAIGVSAPIIPLGLDAHGALEVPQDFADTGWWTGGARPGERGPAVIAGHVDSRTGPAVFFRLGELRRGDAITVGRADGSRVRFRVQRAARYPKAEFPTAAVYGATKSALRLVTCSGTFDRATGHYLDNTVVYAGR